MMEGSPNWWSMNNMHPPSHQPSTFLSSPLPLSPHHQYLPHDHHQSSSSLDLNSFVDHNHDFPESWSQLLLGGLYSSEENRLEGQSHFQYKKFENWEEDQIIDPSLRVSIVDVKQEVNQNSQLYGHEEEEEDDQFQACRPSNWSQVIPVSSPIRSCITTLDFSSSKPDGRNQHQDHSSECNSTGIGGVSKKARVQSSSTQPPLKVRKEKLGDRITALHQLVSPFGKTDTASVLLEAIGYIRFLQSQIQALSSPYLVGSGSGNMSHQHSVQVERGCNIFDEEHGQGTQEGSKDLRSRGLCLVPVSCTHHVGNDNGAQYYWASTIGGGF